MAVRVLFVDGTDTVYYGAHSASRQGQHVVVTKNRDNGPPALVAALKAERVAGVEILERGVVVQTVAAIVTRNAQANAAHS